ncbi:MAG: hypothetical protein V8S93_00600 [Lachnospiraceae bacterium]
MPQRSHYLDWCEKIKEKYSSKGEYGFAGATLTFLQGEKESEQKKSGEERRLMLFFQNLIIYWQNSIGIKVSIGNTRVLEQSIRTALEIAMKSLSREEETKFFREVKIARELLEGKVRPEAEMRASQVFRRWQEGYTWEEISGLREIRESIDNPEKRREIRRETARIRTAGLTDRRVQQIQERTGELPESRTVYLEREERKESSPELQKTIESIKEISRIREEIKTREENLTGAEKKFQSERAKENARMQERERQTETELRLERQKQTETELRQEKERRIETERRLEKQKENRNTEEELRLGHQDHREERIPEKLQLPGKQEAQIEPQLRATESYRKEDESGNQLTKREEIHEIQTWDREDVISGAESVPDREPEYEIPVKPAGNEKLELPESRMVYLEDEGKKESSSEFQKTTESIREISRIREEIKTREEKLTDAEKKFQSERAKEKVRSESQKQTETELRETESYRKEDESGNQLTKREEIHEIQTPGREDVISGEESVPDGEPEYEIPVKPAGNEKLELPESRMVYLEHEGKKESSSEFQKTTENIREISRIREEIKTREENLTDAEKKFQSERAKEKVRSERQKQIEMKLRSERQKQTETELRQEKERRIEAERRLERQKQVETELRLERQKQLQAEEKRRSEQQQREDIEFRLEKQKQTRTARQQKEKWNQGEEILSDRQDRRKVRLQGVLPPLRDHEVQVGSAGNEKPELPESRLVYLESEPTALSAGPKTHRIGRADQFLPLTIAGRSALTGQKLVGDRTNVIMKSLLTEKIWKNAQETVKEKRSVTEKEAVFGRSEVQFPKNVKLTDRIPAEKSDSASGKMEQRTILRHTDSIIKLLNTIDHPETKTKLQVLMGNHENTAVPVNFRNLIKRQGSITELQKILGRPENRINLQTIKFQTIMSHPENLRNRTSYAEIIPQIRIPDLAQTTKIQYIEPHGKEKPGRSVTNSEFSEISEKLIQTREETRILRRDSGYARSTLAEQEKKISGLRQELHEQMKHVNEEVKRLTDTRQQESSVRNMADRVMKELQKQFRTEKIRRGY